MKFGGLAFFIDRSDINTDEIIPAKYLTEISKQALKPHLLEDLHLENIRFDPNSPALQNAKVLVTRSNFGCGSSREHAVWALEVNDINVVIAASFARIFRQNMFNCGILAIELSEADIEKSPLIPQQDDRRPTSPAHPEQHHQLDFPSKMLFVEYKKVEH
jgi:3-isopropylmalate/(R)-2-methylmalate dehydratase small subunit